MAHSYLLNDVPEDLRSLLINEARHRLTSRSSHVNGILAARYGIPYQAPVPRGLERAPNGDPMLLRIPNDVMQAIRKEANKRKITFRSVILDVLSEHFGLEPPPLDPVDPKRRPGRPKHGRPRGRRGVKS